MRRRAGPLAFVALLVIAALAGVVAFLPRVLVPKLSEEQVRQTVLTTIERETPAAFLITGTLDATATVALRSTKTVLPGVLDLRLGTSTATVRVPGRIAYGFDARSVRASAVRVAEDGAVEVDVPALTVFSVEPDLRAMQVQTERGWARSSESLRALETEALRGVQDALRRQGAAYLAGDAVQARANTARALETMLRPALVAAGLEAPRFRFRLGPGLVQERPG